ncbi:MAG: T9SS type A sorting domain-containing protein, partial [Fidelibacterota bacterium]
VDDYLHQAADSTNWPPGIRYDPEHDDSVLASLGVHEHWNDAAAKLYSRDLGTGEGIELLKLVPETPTASEPATNLPTAFSLESSYPNPFNPSTTIRYQLPRAGEVTLVVYDILGREVAILVDGYTEPGYYEVHWNGRRFPSGTYFTRLTTPDYTKSIKMLLLK